MKKIAFAIITFGVLALGICAPALVPSEAQITLLAGSSEGVPDAG